MKKTISILVIFSLFIIVLNAQSLQDKMQIFANDSGKGYIQPLNFALNSAVNTGLFSSAKSLHPFQFEFTLNTNLTFIPKEDKTFIANRPDIQAMGMYVYEPPTQETATIFGDKGNTFNVTADFLNMTNLDNINLPDGLNINAMPFVSPQINMGLPFGLEIGLRYFPLSVIDKETFKNSYFYGFGLKYNPKIILPIDISAYGYINSINAEKVVSLNTFSSGLIIGKKLLNYEFYGSMNYSASYMKVDYQTETVVYQPPSFQTVPVKIKFNLSDSAIKPRLGISYTFLLLKVNADVSLGRYPTYNFGLSIKTP